MLVQCLIRMTNLFQMFIFDINNAEETDSRGPNGINNILTMNIDMYHRHNFHLLHHVLRRDDCNYLDRSQLNKAQR